MFLCIFQIKYVRKQNKQCYTSRAGGSRSFLWMSHSSQKYNLTIYYFFLAGERRGVIPFPIWFTGYFYKVPKPRYYKAVVLKKYLLTHKQLTIWLKFWALLFLTLIVVSNPRKNWRNSFFSIEKWKALSINDSV